MKSPSLGNLGPPPDDLAMEAINALFPEKPPRPKPRTLYDDLPEGITDGDPPPPPLKVPEPVVLFKEREADELVPAFGKVRRVSFNDLMQHSWMIERLVARCPHLTPAQAQSHVRGYLYDPHNFLQMTDNAIACARYVRDSFTPPQVELMFVLHRDIGPEGGNIKGSQGERDAVQLVRAIRDWGKLKGASAMCRLNMVSDLPAGVFVQECKGQRRDEVWIPL